MFDACHYSLKEERPAYHTEIEDDKEIRQSTFII